MENGKAVEDGPAETLRGNGDVGEFYLRLGPAERWQSSADPKSYERRKPWVF
jgi:hypothetical protein